MGTFFVPELTPSAFSLIGFKRIMCKNIFERVSRAILVKLTP